MGNDLITVYVESNFLVEYARQQENAGAVEQIIALAESGSIALAYPAFALLEPLSTLSYFNKTRQNAIRQFESLVMNELARSTTYQSVISQMKPGIPTLNNVGRDELNSIETTITRMLAAGRSIALTSEIFTQSLRCRDMFSLDLRDAIMAASVLFDIKNSGVTHLTCFLSQNSRDFDSQKLRDEFKLVGCRYIAKYDDGFAFIHNLIVNRPQNPQVFPGTGGQP